MSPGRKSCSDLNDDLRCKVDMSTFGVALRNIRRRKAGNVIITAAGGDKNVKNLGEKIKDSSFLSLLQRGRSTRSQAQCLYSAYTSVSEDEIVEEKAKDVQNSPKNIRVIYTRQRFSGKVTALVELRKASAIRLIAKGELK